MFARKLAFNPVYADTICFAQANVEAFYYTMMTNYRPRVPYVKGSIAYTLLD